MTPPFIILEKKIGETPLQALNAWRAEHPEYKDTPATYAGRLDPMASGTLLILLGEECKRREQYLGLDKEYEIELVFGCSTDTGDALGMPTLHSLVPTPTKKHLRSILPRVRGTHIVPYPAFSSKTVNGIPLFQYALEQRLNEISIPKHEETIYTIEIISVQTITSDSLLARIQSLLTLAPRVHEPSKRLGADFRQDSIRDAWSTVLAETDTAFTLVRLRVTCASGTYMRTLTSRIAKELGTEAFALSIHRSRLGRYIHLGPLRFWRTQFRR